MGSVRTRTDVMLELLDELDAICRSNGLKYSISGVLAKSLVEDGKLPDSFDYIALAMTTGDIDRLRRIIEKENREDRYFEYMVNNPYQLKLRGGYRYGNSKTTLISASSFGKNKYYGIFIYIIEIKKNMRSSGIVKYNQLLHSSYLYDGESGSSIKRTIKNIIKSRVDEERDKRARQTVYDYYLTKRGIDRWDDIKDVSSVSVSKRTFEKSEVDMKDWDIIEVQSGETSYMYCPMLKFSILGNKASHAIVSDLEIVDTEIPFDEIMDSTIIDHVIAAHKLRKARNEIQKKGKEEFKYTRRAWRTYQMAKEIIEIQNDFHEAKDSENKRSLNEILDLYIERKESWTKREYPFFEVNEIEEEIKKRGR